MNNAVNTPNSTPDPDNILYSKTFPVTATMVDMHLRMRLSTLFSILQEAAIESTVQLGVGRDKTLDRGLLWIVTHHSARISRMPRYDERLTLTTWPGKAMHLFFPRYWRITDEKNHPLVDASSMWVLMEKKARKIAFPENYGISLPGVSTGYEIPLPRRPRFPEPSSQASFTVPPSYVDMNGHLNNARYFDVVQDLLPLPYYQRELKEISMEYVNEVLLGQTLQVRHEEDTDKVSVLGQTDQTVFRMVLDYWPSN